MGADAVRYMRESCPSFRFPFSLCSCGKKDAGLQDHVQDETIKAAQGGLPPAQRPKRLYGLEPTAPMALLIFGYEIEKSQWRQSKKMGVPRKKYQ